jgi:hypothetical protein
VTRTPVIPASRTRADGRLAAIALGLVLTVAACTGGTGGGNPEPPGTATPLATSTGSPAAGTESPASSAADCVAAEMTASGGPWGAAAGSRWAEVTVGNKGSAECLLPAVPVLAVIDSTGLVLAERSSTELDPGPLLGAGGLAQLRVQLGNSCESGLALPLDLVISFGEETIGIEGTSIATEDDVPPCNAPGDGIVLEVSDWETP